jgi:magnesium chelatase family protein
MVTRYQKRISGPLLDPLRVDIHIEVPRVPHEKLTGERLGESSDTVAVFRPSSEWPEQGTG